MIDANDVDSCGGGGCRPAGDVMHDADRYVVIFPTDEAVGIMFSGCPSVCACRAEAFSDRLAVDFSYFSVGPTPTV